MSYSLLAHVLDGCADPDCEIHRIENGLAEETVTDADLAFFIAGAQAMAVAVRQQFRITGTAAAQHDLATAVYLADRQIRHLAEGRS